LPETLVESEIFGYEKGAFTGAVERKPGRFERAHQGTLFLDEIGNLSVHVQMKLLRVLQEGEVERLGGKQGVPIDARLIAAANSNLENLMRRGVFRDDLYHRLNVFVIWLPPLREREGDLEVLSKYFLERFNRELNRSVQGISPEAMALMRGYGWPGNVRELLNAIKSAVILTDDWIFPQHLPAVIANGWGALQPPAVTAKGTEQGNEYSAGLPVSETDGLKTNSRQAAKEVERKLIVKMLLNCHWNKAQAARRLGVDYKTLYNKIKTYQITREQVA
jgi:transcriptional regulator with GAF, ATPase, and Fis domain